MGMALYKCPDYLVVSLQVCQLWGQQKSADACVHQERRVAERQIQFYLKKLDELRSYLTTGTSTAEMDMGWANPRVVLDWLGSTRIQFIRLKNHSLARGFGIFEQLTQEASAV